MATLERAGRFEINGAMEEAAKRYRQGLHDGQHPVDAVRLAVLATWGAERQLSFLAADERRFVAALLRGARKMARGWLPLVDDDEPRERSLSLSECRPEVLS